MSQRNYEKYKARYERGGCTREQLVRLVELGALTQEEFTMIVGMPEVEPEEEPEPEVE